MIFCPECGDAISDPCHECFLFEDKDDELKKPFLAVLLKRFPIRKIL
jgi:hypothetical protein